MKFKVKSTGAILETNNDFAIKQMEKSPNYEVVTESEGKSLDKMTIAELKALAEERGIDIPDDVVKKADILALLKEPEE